MNLSAFIEGLLSRRKQLVPRLVELDQALQQLANQLDDILKSTSAFEQQGELPWGFNAAITQLRPDLSRLRPLIVEQQVKTRNLQVRYNKSTINIGVAGRPGQGKSTLLQAVSGLQNDVIPAAKGASCTGAKSRIFHNQGEPHATIEYFQESEFLKDVVHSYYEQLDLPDRPGTLAEFERCTLPKLKSSDSPGSHLLIEKLQRLHRDFAKFKSYLNCGVERVAVSNLNRNWRE